MYRSLFIFDVIMIGNDIIDLTCSGLPTPRHLKKIYSFDDMVNHHEDKYWTILSLKESAYKCLKPMIGLNSYIPTHFSISHDMEWVLYRDGTRLKIIHIDINEDTIHTIVSVKPDARVVLGVCDFGKHRESLLKSYSEETGYPVTEIEKDHDGDSPNGYGPPRILERPGVPISFSHDGKFAAWCYLLF